MPLRTGHIINISSGAGSTPSAPGGVAYSASKHGVHALTGSINLEERRHGIKACVIAPGEVDTPNLDVRPRPPARADLAQMLRPEDIAAAVIYVASQPEHVSIDLLVVTPTVRRNYQADYEQYVAEGHTNVLPGLTGGQLASRPHGSLPPIDSAGRDRWCPWRRLPLRSRAPRSRTCEVIA